MLPENEYTEYEERKYVNPEVSLNEQLGFIDQLRATQQANNAQIRQDTYNLGTAVPSNLGGLVGGEGYFTSRYQTPQTNALVADLRASAQAKALNDALKNEQDMMKQRYNKARQAYNRRARAAAQTPTSTGTTPNIEEEDTSQVIGSVVPNFSPAASGVHQYTPNTSTGGVLESKGVIGTGGVLDTGGVLGTGGTLNKTSNIKVQRNSSGIITSLTYNGKKYDGAAAEKMFNRLVSSGTVGPVWR